MMPRRDVRRLDVMGVFSLRASPGTVEDHPSPMSVGPARICSGMGGGSAGVAWRQRAVDGGKSSEGEGQAALGQRTKRRGMKPGGVDGPRRKTPSAMGIRDHKRARESDGMRITRIHTIHLLRVFPKPRMAWRRRCVRRHRTPSHGRGSRSSIACILPLIKISARPRLPSSMTADEVEYSKPRP